MFIDIYPNYPRGLGDRLLSTTSLCILIAFIILYYIFIYLNYPVSFGRSLISLYHISYLSLFSEVWENALDQSESIIYNISVYLDCFELDKFEPVDTGEEFMLGIHFDMTGWVE